MGKKPKSKQPAAPAEAGQDSSKKETRFQRWHLIVMVIVALIALIPFFWAKVFEKDPPRFALKGTYFRPDADILLFPENRSAQNRQALDIRFDGYKFDDAGKLNHDSEEIQWQFALQQHNPAPPLVEDGPHKIHFGFNGVFSDSAKIYFDSKAPQTRVGISGDDAGTSRCLAK